MLDDLDNYQRKIAEFGRFGGGDISVYGLTMFAGDVTKKVPKTVTYEEKKVKTERLKSLIDIRTRSTMALDQKRGIATTMSHKVPSDTLYKPKAGASQ